MALKASLTDAASPKRVGGHMRGDTAPSKATAPAQDEVGPDPAKSGGRSGKVSIGFWTAKEARKQLHMLALQEDTTAEKLMNEALNLLFRNRDLPRVARVEE